MGAKYGTEQEKKNIATQIQEYITSNNHRLRRTKAVELAPAIFKRNSNEHYNINDEMDLQRYHNYMQRLKSWGVLRYQQEEPGGPRRWSVNPAYLDKTGVVTHIPMVKPEPKPPTVVQTLDEEKVRQQGVAFIEEEMKKVEIALAVVHYAGANLEMTEVNLYQLYKIALSIHNVCEKASKPMLPDLPASQSEKNEDSEEETETEDSQFEFGQTETEDTNKPF